MKQFVDVRLLYVDTGISSAQSTMQRVYRTKCEEETDQKFESKTEKEKTIEKLNKMSEC